MNITIVGAGRWGSSLAWYLTNIKKYNITLYGRESERTKLFFTTRKNEYIELNNLIKTSFNINDVINCDYTILTLPSQGIRLFLDLLKTVKNYQNHKYILCMKGLEKDTGLRLSEILNEYGINNSNIAVWAGPCHIQNIQKGLKTIMIIDSENNEFATNLVNNFKSELIDIEVGNDFIGTEIGAATKNIVGIGAGIIIGNGNEALIPELKKHALYEVGQIIKLAGGKQSSAYGVCHYGDYVATVDSPYSHNRMLGVEISQNIHHNSKYLAEGLNTVIALKSLLEKLKSDITNYPLIYEIYKSCNNLPYNIEKVLKKPLKI